MSKTTDSALVAAAKSLADDMKRFETLSAELSRLTINSKKSLERAYGALEACAEHEARLAQSLRAFSEAMAGMQLSQQRCVELASSAAERIRARQEARARLQQLLADLADKARDATVPLPALADSEGTGAEGKLRALQEVEQRLEQVIADAGALVTTARDDDWADFERDAHALQQQLLDVRNRVLMFRRKLAEAAPS